MSRFGYLAMFLGVVVLCGCIKAPNAPDEKSKSQGDEVVVEEVVIEGVLVPEKPDEKVKDTQPVKKAAQEPKKTDTKEATPAKKSDAKQKK